MKITLYKAKKRKHKRKHGFLVRSRSKSGRTIVKKRRQKGRKNLTA